MAGELIFGPLLLVYQMPKTGSQTVEATLAQCGVAHRIIRVHFLSRALAARVAGAMGPARGACQREQFARATELRRALHVRRWLKRCGLRLPKVQAICAVRDPIGMELAALFENHSDLFTGPEEANVAACREEMLKPRDRLFAREWFNLELKAMLGIDVYRTAFPREQGYAIYQNGFARGLVYRFEALKNLAVFLGEFLGREIPAVVNRNIGEAKPYGRAYRRTKEQLRLPADFVRALCHCRMMRHFYSQEERQAFEARWSEVQQIRPEVVTSVPEKAAAACMPLASMEPHDGLEAR